MLKKILLFIKEIFAAGEAFEDDINEKDLNQLAEDIEREYINFMEIVDED